VARARETWWADPDGVGGIGPERLPFPDECGALTNMVRLYGRGPLGARARASAPFGHWTRVTGLGALGHEGVVGAMRVAAATGAAVFHAYLEQVLLPEPRRTKPDAGLVMDNLPAHKAPEVRALLDASGLACRHLPAHSPDLNPIEPAWAKVKAAPRRRAHGGGAARRVRPGPGRHHPARRSRVLPPLRLQPSQLTCGLL